MVRGVFNRAPPGVLLLLAILMLSLLGACSGQQNPEASTQSDTSLSDGSGAEEAVAASETRSEALNRQLDALLAENLTESDYQESFDCLYRNNFRDVSALGDTYMLFSKGSAYFINRLRNRCILLNRRMLFTFVSHSRSVCAGDSVYLSDRSDLDRGFDASGRPAVMQGICVLGEFEAINEAQAMALKAAVKSSGQ